MTPDIASILKNMDKATLQKSVSEAKRFLSTPEGKSAMEKIKKGEMPDGGQLPSELKGAADALAKDPATARSLAKLFGL